MLDATDVAVTPLYKYCRAGVVQLVHVQCHGRHLGPIVQVKSAGTELCYLYMFDATDVAMAPLYK